MINIPVCPVCNKYFNLLIAVNHHLRDNGDEKHSEYCFANNIPQKISTQAEKVLEQKRKRATEKPNKLTREITSKIARSKEIKQAKAKKLNRRRTDNQAIKKEKNTS